MRVPGGGASCLGVGHLGSGALPAPITRPFGRAAGAHYPLAVGAGVWGMGTRHQPHSARSWFAAKIYKLVVVAQLVRHCSAETVERSTCVSNPFLISFPVGDGQDLVSLYMDFIYHVCMQGI